MIVVLRDTPLLTNRISVCFLKKHCSKMQGDEGTYPSVTRFGSHGGGQVIASQPQLSESNECWFGVALRKCRDFEVR